MPSSDSISASQPLPSCTLHHQGSQPSGALDLSWSFLAVGKENKGLWAWLYSIFQKVSAFEGLPGSDSLLPTSKGAAATSCHPIPPPHLLSSWGWNFSFHKRVQKGGEGRRALRLISTTWDARGDSRRQSLGPGQQFVLSCLPGRPPFPAGDVTPAPGALRPFHPVLGFFFQPIPPFT